MPLDPKAEREARRRHLAQRPSFQPLSPEEAAAVGIDVPAGHVAECSTRTGAFQIRRVESSPEVEAEFEGRRKRDNRQRGERRDAALAAALERVARLEGVLAALIQLANNRTATIRSASGELVEVTARDIDAFGQEFAGASDEVSRGHRSAERGGGPAGAGQG